MKPGLSVVIAIHNEALNLPKFFAAVKPIADEIIVVDGQSDDDSASIARSYGAKVYVVPNQKNFHINKQLAITKAKLEWVLMMDADEIITPALAKEIRAVVAGSHKELDLSLFRTFRSHMNNIATRDGVTYTQDPPINGYFIARKNFFLGSYLMHSAVYPDGVIRLFKNGYGHHPAVSVHEQIAIVGGVSWLKEPMIHYSDPTFARYLWRANRYTDLTAKDLEAKAVSFSPLTFINYMFLKPVSIFLLLFFRHKGFLDGFSGFVWSLMSGLHWPIAYMKYYENTH